MKKSGFGAPAPRSSTATDPRLCPAVAAWLPERTLSPHLDCSLVSPAEGLLPSLRRRYRQARIKSALQHDSTAAHQHGMHVVHMLHVRKTGGTAVKAALQHADQPKDLKLLLHGHGISLREIPAHDDVFFFLREPVSRFKSGFEMRRREGRPRHYSPWTPEERRAFTLFATAEALAMALGSRDGSERAQAQAAMNSIYHVRSHLTDWLIDEDLVRSRQHQLIFIGWQERLGTDFADLLTSLGMPASTRLPDDRYTANRADLDASQTLLSARAVELIRGWYADDYRLIALLATLGLTRPPDEVAVALGEVAAG